MLRIAKLPDRTPIKIGFTVTPDLARSLADYTTLYNKTYGDKAELADLLPSMLESFLASDKVFSKARKSAAGGS